MTKRPILITLACVALLNGLASPMCRAEETAGDDANADRRDGARIFLTSCAPCHGLKYVRLQTLTELGFSDVEIDTMLPGSRFDTPLNSWIAADDAETVFGLAPPDLSLITKAREEGKEHVYKLLTGYHKVDGGGFDNAFLPGVRMPDVFSYAMATDPEWRQELEHRAERTADFLEWAADPKADERRELGYYVIAYLLVLTTLLYLVKRRVWAGLKEPT